MECREKRDQVEVFRLFKRFCFWMTNKSGEGPRQGWALLPGFGGSLSLIAIYFSKERDTRRLLIHERSPIR